MYKSIGIIGGMGPAATADLMKKIIDMTDASCDQEHIHMLIEKLCIILEDLDADPIREIRHAVILFELGIADSEVNITVHCRYPAENRSVVQRWMDEVLLDGQ